MGVIATEARHDLFVCGVNLDGVVAMTDTVRDLIDAGVRVRLLVLDPDGSSLPVFSRFSDVDPAVRRGKIASNLRYLADQLGARDAQSACELRVVDSFLSVGCIGVDLDTAAGKLFVQQYLYRTGTNEAPLLALTRTTDERWFRVYLRQFELLWNEGRELHREKS